MTDVSLVRLCPLNSMVLASCGRLFGGSRSLRSGSTPLESLLNRFRGRGEPRFQINIETYAQKEEKSQAEWLFAEFAAHPSPRRREAGNDGVTHR